MTRRIGRRSIFARFGRDGHRISLGPVWVSVLPDTEATPPHVAYAVGGAVGNAVVRNRVRRRLRAIIGELAPSLPPGWYLVGARPPAAHCSSAELRAALAPLPGRARTVSAV